MERNRESFYRGSLETKGNFRGKPDATLGMATTESVVFYRKFGLKPRRFTTAFLDL